MTNKLYSPVRITPFLVIKEKKDYYHELECLKVKIPCLYDIITINKSEIDKFSCIFKIKNHHINDKENLVLYVWDKMIKLYEREYPEKEAPNFNIILEKNIPVGAGLAGGSSNAATLIEELNKILNLDKGMDELIRIGNKLGKDIGFFLTGYDMAIDTEINGIKKVDYSFPESYMLLVTPNIKISSKKAYELYDKNCPNNKIKPDINDIIKATEDNDIEKFSSCLYNDFELIILKEYPELGDLKKIIYRYALNSVISGSGSSIISFFPYYEKGKSKALNLIDDLKKKNIPYIKLIDTKEGNLIN